MQNEEEQNILNDPSICYSVAEYSDEIEKPDKFIDGIFRANPWCRIIRFPDLTVFREQWGNKTQTLPPSKPTETNQNKSSMRTINTHKVNQANDTIEITVMDEPGAGGANHVYELSWKKKDGTTDKLTISFQNGPIAEAGVNGPTHEALLAIVLDRLNSFQQGPYKSRENAIAFTHIETGLLYLFKRTWDRMQRGVEGTSTV